MSATKDPSKLPVYIVDNPNNGNISSIESNSQLSAGTRLYNFSAATRTAVGAVSVTTLLGTLNSFREIMITADTDCYVVFGTSSGVTVSASDAAALRIFAGERFHLRVSNNTTHFAVIRSTSDGFIRVIPVA